MVMQKRCKDHNSFQDSFDEDPAILESVLKTAFKAIGRNKPVAINRKSI